MEFFGEGRLCITQNKGGSLVGGQGSPVWLAGVIEKNCEELIGCNNGGRGGNFPKVKRLVAKWVGTRKRLFSSFFAEVV